MAIALISGLLVGVTYTILYPCRAPVRSCRRIASPLLDMSGQVSIMSNQRGKEVYFDNCQPLSADGEGLYTDDLRGDRALLFSFFGGQFNVAQAVRHHRVNLGGSSRG